MGAQVKRRMRLHFMTERNLKALALPTAYSVRVLHKSSDGTYLVAIERGL